ncbi:MULTISPECIES: 2-dehydro-3-deoxy-6-phosphogalactonate aldolase [unclassified Citrobacter]|uniref:2-dehydro-3-deoxy-6-phosphogalactonate aldolase n=1 Tax=unclassified Citrobacter TaxID=2644389 RepID=UPI00230329AF|nr:MULTISPECIES: 2-dehydro-3-deoxy-6-phosphogalactonate aldolase [unclassified Citrobacter]MDA8511529.1 2-dehydro-3-deoxy-6-phosphogalactonate aldolase [Citrobacter sp. Igbk 14]MDA8518534.1 2-dehydro-3-deoxy-6-phosphogalactonate aldolase [Citrobacter sp. Igbk 16]
MDSFDFATLWQKTPLPMIAILRGLTPEEAPDIGDVLLEAGFTWLEVPLNSPRALDSITLLRERVGERAIVGAGTVLTAAQVDSVVDAGGQVIISPNMNTSVIRRSRERGAISLPGVITPSEAFTALDAGASGLKFYPAEMISPDILRAMCVVLPPHVICMPVGGVSAEVQQLQNWMSAGAKGFGCGGGLYRAGTCREQVMHNALAYAQAWQQVNT